MKTVLSTKVLITTIFSLSVIISCNQKKTADEKEENQFTIEPTLIGRGSGSAYAFPFFYGQKHKDTVGMWMAISKDGLDWKVVNNNEVVFKRPFGNVLRDPAISQAPDGTYHLVFTVGSNNPVYMGYARSKDLIHWKDARMVDLMGSVEGTANVWAPELFYDKVRERWMVYWASSVEGRFPETKQLNERANNRMYCAFTTDFVNVTEPKLLYTKHIVNDTRIINYNSQWGKYCMVVKHIKRPGTHAELYLAYSKKIDGPYINPFDSIQYISKPYRFCEGPAVIKIDDYYYCYFDLSREHHMACKRSKDMLPGSWEDMTDWLTIPAEVKHGDIVRIPIGIYNKLEKLGDI